MSQLEGVYGQETAAVNMACEVNNWTSDTPLLKDVIPETTNEVVDMSCDVNMACEVNSWTSDTPLLKDVIPETTNEVVDISCDVNMACDANSWTSDTPLLKDVIPETTNEAVDMSCDVNSLSSDTPLLKDVIPETAHEAVGMSCDVNNWSSDTSLLKDVIECVVPGPDQLNNEYAAINQILDHCIVIDATTGSSQVRNIEHLFDSSFSIALSEIEEVEPSINNDIHVIGSGWEFGSICSIHYRSHTDISKSNTMDTQSNTFKNRLLSKIFKEKVGSVDIIKSYKKDVSPVDLIPSDANENTNNQNNQKNLFILSCGVMLLHIAIYGLRNLQSSLNSKQGLGVLSLAVLCGSYMIFSLISSFIVRRYRPKNCLSVSCIGHLFYVVANYYPTAYTIMPAAFLQGAANALLWNAISTYITEIGYAEGARRRKSVSSVLSRYFGVLFLTLQLAMVFGNLASSVILSQTGRESLVLDNTTKNTSADTVAYDIDNLRSSVDIFANLSKTAPSCGVQSCSTDDSADLNPPIDDLDKVFLLGTYLSCGILSVLVIHCCLEPLQSYSPPADSVEDVLRQVKATFTIIFDSRFCYLVVLCLYTVIGNGFVVADVLKVFITCPLGMRMVGYSMICFGVCGSISSYIFGKLAKWTGNIAAFLTAGGMNVACLALLIVWKPTSDDVYFLMAFIGAWGFADGIWQSQTNSLMSSTFADNYETAFGCFRVLQGLAGIIVFGISSALCMMTKIIITSATCLMSVVFYMIFEIVNRRQPAVTNVLIVDSTFKNEI